MTITILGDTDDTLNRLAQTVSETIIGLGGDDTIWGSRNDDVIDGGADDDNLNGNLGDDLIYGGAGNDVIRVWVGDDVAFGGAGNDTLRGYWGANTLYGGDGDDLLETGEVFSFSGDGRSRLFGGAGDDTFVINDGGEDDLLFGGDGNDTFKAIDDYGSVFGGSGYDIYDMSDFSLDQRVFINDYEGRDLTVSRDTQPGLKLTSIEEIILPTTAVGTPYIYFEGDDGAPILVRGSDTGNEVFLDATFASYIGGRGERHRHSF